MKVAVIGALGQLGVDVCNEFEKDKVEVVRLDIDNVDITKIHTVNRVLTEIKPEIIINTAAYHDVEQCEKNPCIAYEVNAIGAKNLALVSNDLNCGLIHISTDYVFNGNKDIPYLETDTAFPLNVYGNTKLAGERFISAFAKKFLILRTSGLYGKSPCRGKGGLNFVELMLKLAKERDEVRVVDHEILTPTSTLQLARQIVNLKEPDFYGIAHATPEGYCSWYQFTKEIFRLKNIKTTLNIAKPGEFPEKVARPYYSVLENNVLNQYNHNIMNHWSDGLKEYLK